MNEEKFTGKAELYNKNRPSYPPRLVHWLFKKTNDVAAADIGAGTGIFTKSLSEKFTKITAEPRYAANLAEKCSVCENRKRSRRKHWT